MYGVISTILDGFLEWVSERLPARTSKGEGGLLLNPSGAMFQDEFSAISGDVNLIEALSNPGVVNHY